MTMEKPLKVSKEGRRVIDFYFKTCILAAVRTDESRAREDVRRAFRGYCREPAGGGGPRGKSQHLSYIINIAHQLQSLGCMAFLTLNSDLSLQDSPSQPHSHVCPTYNTLSMLSHQILCLAQKLQAGN